MRPVSDLQTKGTTHQASWLHRRHIQDRLLHLIGSHGYQVLEIPILAPAELFLRKSGGELASQMISFLDPGSNSICLRPEFTAPIMLHHLGHADEVTLPARWQYSGPVFRYEAAGNGQFTQIGAELIGSTSVMADAELVGLAAEILDEIGVQDYEVRLADLQVLQDLLDTVGISERARTFIIGSIPQLRNRDSNTASLLERAQYLHLTGSSPPEHDLSDAVAGLDDARARGVLRGFLRWSAGGPVGLGQRDPEEVIEGLLHKIRGGDDREGMERALNLVSGLSRIHGEPEAAVQQARGVLGPAGAKPEALDRLAELIQLLRSQAGLADNLVLDFGLARGLAYYNGITFQVTHPRAGATLGGGGRYDALARALGSAGTVPALGFAYNLDLLAQLAAGDPPGTVSGPANLLGWPSYMLVVWDVPASRPNALAAAREFRRSGIQVETAAGDMALSDALAYAAKKGISQVVVVGPEGPGQAHQVGPGI
jgi:histidyl-tRNA synthetase